MIRIVFVNLILNYYYFTNENGANFILTDTESNKSR